MCFSLRSSLSLPAHMFVRVTTANNKSTAALTPLSCAMMCAEQGPYRSRSAPREEAAARRHIERMQGSPTRAAPAAAVRDSILGAQQQQLLLQQQGLLPWRQQRSSQASGSSRSSAAFSSPTSRKVCTLQKGLQASVCPWEHCASRAEQNTHKAAAVTRALCFGPIHDALACATVTACAGVQEAAT